MQFTPTDSLFFQYKSGTHLHTTLNIKNTSNAPLGFKFKVTTPNRFHINPNIGLIKPASQAIVNIVIHREIVDHAEDEKVQVLYGEKYQESRYFNLIIENGSKNDRLNLTMIVNQKEEEIKQIKKEIGEYKSIPINTLPSNKGKSSRLNFAIVAIVGLLMGYFVPFQLLGK